MDSTNFQSLMELFHILAFHLIVSMHNTRSPCPMETLFLLLQCQVLVSLRLSTCMSLGFNNISSQYV